MEGGEATHAVHRRAVDLDADQDQGIGDLYELYAFTKRNGVDYNLIYIPSDFSDTSTQAFDPVYMSKLYDLGFQMASNGSSWKKVPPRWDH